MLELEWRWAPRLEMNQNSAPVLESVSLSQLPSVLPLAWRLGYLWELALELALLSVSERPGWLKQHRLTMSPDHQRQ